MNENLFNRLGFTTDPFAYTNADEEENINEYFIKPPYFDSVIGDYNSPNTCVVLAPRGAGKTAQRRMIEIWTRNNPVLAVTYDRFEFSAGQKLNSINLAYHLRNIITKVLLNLLIRATEYPEILSNVPKEKKRQLSVLCHNYLGNLTGQNVSEVISDLKSIPQKIKEYWNKNVGFLEPIINFILRRYDLDTIDLPNLKQEEKKLEGTYKYQLELLFEIAQELGFRAIYILVDKVDETELTGNNADNTYKLIEPLLRDLDILSLRGYGFKFFLWDKIYPYYVESARPDRIPQFELNWNRSQLEKLLSERLKAFSKTKIQKFADTFTEANSPSIDSIVCMIAFLSPRNVIRFCNEIIAQQSLINADTTKLEMRALELASTIFSQKIATELYGIDMYKDIIKVDKELFSINYLSNNIFKSSHINTSRNKVTEWSKAGAIKEIGIEKTTDSKRPINLYYLVDPRLNRIVSSKKSLLEFIRDKWSLCPECSSDILIDLANIPKTSEIT